MHTPCFLLNLRSGSRYNDSILEVDFIENSYQDRLDNAECGNVIFTCRSYIDQKI